MLGLTNLTWVTAGYGWFTLVAPILAAAPLYFAGDLSFGGLMLAAGAFTQVQSSMRWFIDNFSVIADWRATLLRVASFRRATLEAETLHRVESQIDFREDGGHVLRIENLEIASPAGATMLKEKHVEVKPGDRVLIVGEPGTGKTLLFRALAGLWPWGSGTLTRPKEESTLYVPRSPYWPPGTLREALAYPREPASFKEEAFEHALTRLKLQRLVATLDDAGRWEQPLSEEELTSLVFARVVLHNPQWIVIDEVLDSADANTLELIQDVLAKDLKHSAVIHIGRENANDGRRAGLALDQGSDRTPSAAQGPHRCSAAGIRTPRTGVVAGLSLASLTHVGKSRDGFGPYGYRFAEHACRTHPQASGAIKRSIDHQCFAGFQWVAVPSTS